MKSFGLQVTGLLQIFQSKFKGLNIHLEELSCWDHLCLDSTLSLCQVLPNVLTRSCYVKIIFKIYRIPSGASSATHISQHMQDQASTEDCFS